MNSDTTSQGYTGYDHNECDCGPHTVTGPDGYAHTQYGPTVINHPGGYSRAI